MKHDHGFRFSHRTSVLVPTVLALIFAWDACASQTLEGAWQRVSLTNTRTGESPEAANRQGLLIMAHGYYSMMTMNPDRDHASDDEYDAMTAEKKIAYLQEWLDINGHTGRYEVAGDTLIWYREISENPKEVGTTSRLSFEWRDDHLVLYFSLPNGDRYDWVWRRIY
jgi:hypothetical protein